MDIAWSSTVESSPPERPTQAPPVCQSRSMASSAAPTYSASKDMAVSGAAEHPEPAQPLAARCEEFRGRHGGELAQVARERIAQALRHRLRLAVRATERLRDHLVDQLELREAVGRDAHRFRREFAAV